jgi:hypothetical protein
MKSQNKPLMKDGSAAPATKIWQQETAENLKAGLEQFKKDNQGKTLEDLAREQEAHLGSNSE